MDKIRFIEAAPLYYAAAIAAYLRFNNNPTSFAPIEKSYEYSEDDGYGEQVTKSYVGYAVLFDQAIDWLRSHGMIEVILDDFGPPIYEPTPTFEALLTQLERDQALPFYRLHRMGNAWLKQALETVNSTYDELKISKRDFESKGDEWEPIPLERSDPQLARTIGAIDETVELLRGDNGYGGAAPEEKEYVIEGLSAVAKRLKEGSSVSVPYLRRYAIEPLQLLIRRFGGAMIGIAATGAREAIVEFVKQHAAKILTFLFGP